MFQSNDKNYVYATDPRMPCKYGVKCYQKNKVHNEKYKHPAGRKVELKYFARNVILF